VKRLSVFLFCFFNSVLCLNAQNAIDIKDSVAIADNFNIALDFFKERKLDSFHYYTSKIGNYNLSNKQLIKYNFYKATFHKFQDQLDSAFYYYQESKKYALIENDSIEIGRRLFNIGVIKRKTKDFLGAEISLIESLQYLEPLHAYDYLKNIYNCLGMVSKELGNKKSALKFYELALEANKIATKNNLDSKEELAINYLYILNNIGVLYQKFNEFEKSIPYLEEGLSFDSIVEKYPINYAYLLENHTLSKYLVNHNFDVAKAYNKAMQIRQKEKDNWGLTVNNILLSDFYFYTEFNKELSAYYAKEALKYANISKHNKRKLQAYKRLSYLSKGEEAKNYLLEYISLNDSILSVERALKDQFARIRYETDKKEKENVELKSENEKQEAEIIQQKQQNTISWLATGFSVVFLLLSSLFFIYRRKNLLYNAQLQKIEVREQERRQIAKSLHDEVAGDLRLLHRKLEKAELLEEAHRLDLVKDNVRNLSHQLSSVSFDKVTFKDQIINLVSDYFELDFKIKAKGLNDTWEEVNSAIKRLLYLASRECIQNSKKYAEANKLELNFSLNKKNVFLEIADNGKGFDVSSSKKGIGLQNLSERIEELQGTLTIESESKVGTRIYIQIPLNARNYKNFIS